MPKIKDPTRWLGVVAIKRVIEHSIKKYGDMEMHNLCFAFEDLYPKKAEVVPYSKVCEALERWDKSA